MKITDLSTVAIISPYMYTAVLTSFGENTIGLRGDPVWSWTPTLDVIQLVESTVPHAFTCRATRLLILCSSDFYAPWRTKFTSCMELVSKVPALMSSKSSRSFLKSTTLSLRCMCLQYLCYASMKMKQKQKKVRQFITHADYNPTRCSNRRT